MKEPIKAVALPTDDSELGSALFNTVYMHSENKSLVIGYLNARSTKHVPQYIYTTVSQDREKIKNGDWYMNGRHLYQADRHYETASNDRKIIATTDPKLCTTKQNGQLGQAIIRPIGIQQSFIEEFVANPDGEYEVEYLRGSDGHYDDKDVWHWKMLGLKLNQANEVNITSVEKEMFSREDMKKCWNNNYSIGFDNTGDRDKDFDDWIREKLKPS
jgi:hypothetical protein